MRQGLRKSSVGFLATFVMNQQGSLTSGGGASWMGRARASIGRRKYEAQLLATAAQQGGTAVQGDETLNSSEAFVQRQRIKREAIVRTVLGKWWAVALAMARRSRPGCTSLDFDTYASIYHSLFLQIVGPEDYDADEADESVAEEFTNDAEGELEMSQAQFTDGMFEMADLHVPSLEASEYVAFLSTLLEAITDGNGGLVPVNRAVREGGGGAMSKTDLSKAEARLADLKRRAATGELTDAERREMEALERKLAVHIAAARKAASGGAPVASSGGAYSAEGIGSGYGMSGSGCGVLLSGGGGGYSALEGSGYSSPGGGGTGNGALGGSSRSSGIGASPGGSAEQRALRTSAAESAVWPPSTDAVAHRGTVCTASTAEHGPRVHKRPGKGDRPDRELAQNNPRPVVWEPPPSWDPEEMLSQSRLRLNCVGCSGGVEQCIECWRAERILRKKLDLQRQRAVSTADASPCPCWWIDDTPPVFYRRAQASLPSAPSSQRLSLACLNPSDGVLHTLSTSRSLMAGMTLGLGRTPNSAPEPSRDMPRDALTRAPSLALVEAAAASGEAPVLCYAMLLPSLGRSSSLPALRTSMRPLHTPLLPPSPDASVAPTLCLAAIGDAVPTVVGELHGGVSRGCGNMSCKPPRRSRQEVTSAEEQLAAASLDRVAAASLGRVEAASLDRVAVAAAGEYHSHTEPPSFCAPTTAVAAATSLANRERRTERHTERTEPGKSIWDHSLGEASLREAPLREASLGEASLREASLREAPRGRAETRKHGRLGSLAATSTSAATGMKASRVGSSHVGSSNGGCALGSANGCEQGSRHGAGARSFKTKRLSSPATWHLPLTAWMGDPTTERGGGAAAGGGHIGAMLGAGLPLSLTRSIDLLVPFAPSPSLAAAPRARRG